MSRRPATPPDADRTPHCRHFGECGGCSLLDQPIAWQLHAKVAASEKLLAPYLNGQRLASVAPDRSPQHFRTRLLYPIRADRDGLAIVGIYAFRSHQLVRVEECRTQDRWLTAFGRAAESALRELRLPPFRPDSKRGVLKALWARLAPGSGEVVAGVVTQPGAFPAGQELAAAFARAAETLAEGPARRLVGVVHSISERNDTFLLADRHMPLRGRDHIVDRTDGLELRISAGSFYQIHKDANRLLYAPAMAMCGDVRGFRVVDGYGGVGAFGLRLAKAGAAAVTVVEDNAAACRDATHNAKANGLTQVQVQQAAFAAADLPVGADLVVVDPPRSGLGTDGAAKLLAAAPQRILHVACDAEALARDLAILCAGGYHVTAARLCDLFPHTEHQELLVRLDRAS